MFYTPGMNNKRPQFPDAYVKSVRKEYDHDGYVRFPGVIPTAEALELGAELKQLIEDRNTDVQWDGEFIDPEERAKSKILDMHNVFLRSERFEALRHDPRIMARLAILLGGPVIYDHDKGFIKPGARGDTYGGKFPPHQDYPFFPHSDDRVLASILYLTDITEDMGPVKIFPGSHSEGPRETVPGRPYLDDAPFPSDQAVTMTGKAGDMVAFNINTVHMSGPNKSLMDRVSWLIQVKHPDSLSLSPDYRPPNQGEQLWPPVEN